jgi:drug/metabolite transporter (DMT)-like permease
LALTPLYLWELQHGTHWELSTPAVLGIAYTAIFPLLVAYIFWNRAVHEVGANRAGQFLHLLPVFGTLFSTIFLGEKLYSYHYVGVGFVFTGIYFATLWRSSKT